MTEVRRKKLCGILWVIKWFIACIEMEVFEFEKSRASRGESWVVY